jgi:transposase-like protein
MPECPECGSSDLIWNYSSYVTETVKTAEDSFDCRSCGTSFTIDDQAGTLSIAS